MKTQVADLTFELSIPYASIEKRIVEIAAQITNDYSGSIPVMVGILNGSFLFVADLVKQIEIPIEVTFAKLASYYGGTSTTRKIRDDFDLTIDIQGRHIIQVEDIVDTGKTLNEFLPQLNDQQPASLKIVALLHKPDALQYPVTRDYLGFSVPDKFLLGYGLDYDGLARNLKEIYQLTGE